MTTTTAPAGPPRTRHCDIDVADDGGYCVVRVDGRLDWAGAERLRPVLDRAGGAPLILDLRSVSSLDAAGTGLVLARLSRMHRQGRPVALVAGHPAVYHVLLAAGAGCGVPLLTTLEAARDALAGDAA